MAYKTEDGQSTPLKARTPDHPVASSSRSAKLQDSIRRNRIMLRRIGLGVSVAILAISAFIFLRTIVSIDLAQLEAAFIATSVRQIFFAFCLSALSYVALTGYDGLALIHLREKVPFHVTALASFTSYAISFTLGFPLITGGAVRFWIYGPAGLSAGRVASLTVIAGITFWLGMGLVVGSGLIGDPVAVGDIDHFSVLANQLIGSGLVLLLAAYLSWVIVLRSRGRPLFLSLELPGPTLTLGQIALGVIDVCSAAGALYVLLPKDAGPSFLTFSALYSFACMLGIASHAPGGIGVFEATILKGVGGPSEPILASLFLFRAIYYVIPFILAMALLGAHEAFRRWQSLREALDKSEFSDQA
jgi:glycosyltransferase 2 family protein